MSDQPTEFQSPDDQSRARRLSLQRTLPPGAAPGYELQRFLGSGAYGEVWVGTDRNTGRQVAIKFYLHRGGLDWTLLSREVEKLVFLSADRYVVQLLDVGWDAEPPYYVMEYVDNGSLDDHLQSKEQMPTEDAVALFREIAIGLVHAHGRGVLHCDLKPANILLDQDNRPRLADFGQSRLSHEQTPALGTLFYMAPEQADLEAVPDARWDVYALGALLYCLLTGSPPHRNEGLVERIDSAASLTERLECYREEISNAPKPQDHRMDADVDGPLADIVDRCLAVDPEQRYPNVQSVLDALNARQQARRRRPLLLMGLVAPALLLAIMITVYWHAFGRAADQAETMVTQQTFRSNQFAAKFLAKSFESELADFFELAELEAGQHELHANLQIALTSRLLAQLNQLLPDSPEIPKVQERFLSDAERQGLKVHLAHRLALLNEMAGHNRAEFASLFVVDRHGTMVADAYTTDVATRSVGRNFSWRTYFHGGPEDLDRTENLDSPTVIESTHLSAVFKSSTTEKWKVAISTPIYDGSALPENLVGVLALTINVGDFGVFRNRDEATDYFAVLIDNRPGERMGTILQHPLFRQAPPDRDFRLSDEQLAGVRARSDYRYRDPLAEAPGGQPYAGEWIAAAEAVHLPRRNHIRAGQDVKADPQRTDMLVLVQVHADTATAPVRQLRRRLTYDGFIALALILLAIGALWLIVYRISGLPSRQRHRRNLESSDLSAWREMPTVTATHRSAQ